MTKLRSSIVHQPQSKWLNEMICTSLSIDDPFYCEQFLSENHEKLMDFFAETDGGGDAKPTILFIWKLYRTEVVNEFITVFEPGEHSFIYYVYRRDEFRCWPKQNLIFARDCHIAIH